MALMKSRPAARKSAKTAFQWAALVDEIIDVLNELGGASHRDPVMLRLATRRGQRQLSDQLRADLIQAMERHRMGLDGDGGEPLVCLAFGEGSHRWALTPEGRRVGDERMREGMASPASAGYVSVAA